MVLFMVKPSLIIVTSMTQLGRDGKLVLEPFTHLQKRDGHSLTVEQLLSGHVTIMLPLITPILVSLVTLEPQSREFASLLGQQNNKQFKNLNKKEWGNPLFFYTINIMEVNYGKTKTL
jgi:hypothetical protein